MDTPTAQDALRIAESVCGESVVSCERFPTGLRNWVYDVQLASGRAAVVRLSHPDNRAELEGGLFWSKLLTAHGVRVADVLAHDTRAAQPHVVLERLPGTDLGHVLDSLSHVQVVAVAHSVASMQHNAAALPHGSGFGYALSYDSPLESTWLAVLGNQIDRAERWILGAGVVDPAFVAIIRDEVATHEFVDVEPRPFLHDATTKNVIVYGGRVTGLVDVDTMAFGDPLWAAALTRMALFSGDHAMTYADQLAAAMGPYDPARLELYTRIFCLTFLGELGQTFNNDRPEPVDHDLRLRLESLLT